MKKLALLAVVAVLSAQIFAAGKAAEKSAPKPEVLYALGFVTGMKLQVFDLTAGEYKQVERGFKDGAMGVEQKPDLEKNVNEITPLLRGRLEAKSAQEKKESEEFLKKELEKAKKNDKSKILPGNIIYTEITAGKADGKNPKATDTVKVNYKGTLRGEYDKKSKKYKEGKEFDSSYKRGEPAEFPLNAVIPCWTEAVALMKEGGKARLVCPAEKAYGANGAPPTIPGNATLVFEVELLGITSGVEEKKEETKAAPVKADKKTTAKTTTK